MRHYYCDFWTLYGLTPLTIWELPFNDFIGMTAEADAYRREASKTR